MRAVYLLLEPLYTPALTLQLCSNYFSNMYRHFKQILPDEIPISDRHKKRRGILNLPVPRTEVFAT